MKIKKLNVSNPLCVRREVIFQQHLPPDYELLFYYLAGRFMKQSVHAGRSGSY